jgi:hypothetical protein
MKDRLQRQRFEHKYLVSEAVALGVRDFVSSYLELDAFGATQPDNAYPVHTLYLDSPDLALYRSTVNGDRNRFKLRIRFYEKGDADPVYFEIKRRLDKVIIKKRAAVHRDAARWILAGHFPDPDHLVEPQPDALNALDHFATLLNRLQALPQAHVAYRREAWVARGSSSVRVTIDREVKTDRQKRFRLTHEMVDPVPVFSGRVVLELKFTDRFPIWFRELVQVFGLRQGPAAKYVDGVYCMGERGRMSLYL